MQTVLKNTVAKLSQLPPVALEQAIQYIDDLFQVSVESPVDKSDIDNKQAMLNQLLGSMQGVEIDDSKQAYHEHLEEKCLDKPKKRQLGICQGKGSFVIKDDFAMTEEELIGL